MLVRFVPGNNVWFGFRKGLLVYLLMDPGVEKYLRPSILSEMSFKTTWVSCLGVLSLALAGLGWTALAQESGQVDPSLTAPPAAGGPPPPGPNVPEPVAAPGPEDARLDALKKPAVRAIEPGVLQVGDVILRQADKSITFSAAVNMDTGPMEYFLVANYGSVHESVFRTKVKPFNLHVAMLLLGVKVTQVILDVPGSGAGSQTNPSNARIPGHPVEITISWPEGEERIVRKAPELVINQLVEGNTVPVEWVYNGSRINSNTFVSQLSGAMISFITDPDCLMNHVGKGRDNDDIWRAKKELLPAVGKEVEFTIRLLDYEG